MFNSLDNLTSDSKTGTGGRSLSILGPDLFINGTVTSTGEIQIDGNFEGAVRAKVLTLSDKAILTGDVEAETAEIRGALTGNVNARTVRLSATARVEGDIVHETLEVEAGARFDGNCRRQDSPAARPTEGQGAKPASAAAPGAAPAKPAQAKPKDDGLALPKAG